MRGALNKNTEQILWKFHYRILFEGGNSWVKMNTEKERDDGTKGKTQGDKSVGCSEGTGSEGRSGLALTIWLVFSCSSPWGKRGEGVTGTVVIVTGLCFYLMGNTHFLTQHF